MEQRINPPDNRYLSDEKSAMIDKATKRFARYQNIHWDEYLDEKILSDLSGKTIDEIKFLEMTMTKKEILEKHVDSKDYDNARLSVLADKQDEILKDFFEDYDEYTEEEREELEEWL